MDDEGRLKLHECALDTSWTFPRTNFQRRHRHPFTDSVVSPRLYVKFSAAWSREWWCMQQNQGRKGLATGNIQKYPFGRLTCLPLLHGHLICFILLFQLPLLLIQGTNTPFAIQSTSPGGTFWLAWVVNLATFQIFTVRQWCLKHGLNLKGVNNIHYTTGSDPPAGILCPDLHGTWSNICLRLLFSPRNRNSGTYSWLPNQLYK